MKNKYEYVPKAQYCREYMRYLGIAKTARRSYAESVRLLEKKGFREISKVKALKAGDYMPVGDLSTVPADINVGDRLEDSRITVKILSVFTATNTYSNRRVTARETLTVPAGTFDCLLIEDEETFTGAGPFAVKTWIAKGKGIVRQIIYKKDGTVNQVFELALND